MYNVTKACINITFSPTKDICYIILVGGIGFFIVVCRCI